MHVAAEPIIWPETSRKVKGAALLRGALAPRKGSPASSAASQEPCSGHLMGDPRGAEPSARKGPEPRVRVPGVKIVPGTALSRTAGDTWARVPAWWLLAHPLVESRTAESAVVIRAARGSYAIAPAVAAKRWLDRSVAAKAGNPPCPANP